MYTTVEQVLEKLKLKPFDEFVLNRLVKNSEIMLGECNGLRQTGRTTKMLVYACIWAQYMPIGIVCVSIASGNHIKERADSMLKELGISDATINVLKFNWCSGAEHTKVFYDNAVLDVLESRTKNLELPQFKIINI